MTDSPSTPPPGLLEWWVFDLSLPGRADSLCKDESKLRELGARVFVANHLSQPHEFMDGVEIEEQWMKQERWRGTLQALRTELASAVDGEVFLRAARRAVWLAEKAQTGAKPSRINGAGDVELLAAKLAGKLLGVPASGSHDSDSRWKKLFEQLDSSINAA